LGEAGVEVKATGYAGVVKASSVKRVIADTTIVEKAIAHPMDSRLLEASVAN
jgi:IS5 family transposase